jgi:putative ABC transport system permease protein
MGFTDPVGKKIMEQDFEYTVIGVVKDYNYRSLHQAIDPLVIKLAPDITNYIAVRIHPSKKGDVVAALDHMEAVWNEYVTDADFNYRFFDDVIDMLYAPERKIRQIINVFSLLAIVISCLGLFGLALFMAESRTKEIGIRKVNGASTVSTLLLLSRDFTKWVLIALAIAFVLAYFGLDQWLNNYPYRIPLSWWIFAFAGIIALLISWLTVIYQAAVTANKNPVNSLRYE